MNYTVADGKSNWLEGMILMCLYLMLAVTFWYYPGTCFPPCSSGRAPMLMALCDELGDPIFASC